MHRRHGGHAQIQFAPLDAQVDPAVLGQAAFGNIEMGQQLDPRHHRRGHGRRHGLAHLDHTIHPIAHMQTVVEGLQVDVRGLQVDDPRHDLVHQADHRRFAGQILQMLNEVAASFEVITASVAFIVLRGRLEQAFQAGFDVAL